MEMAAAVFPKLSAQLRGRFATWWIARSVARCLLRGFAAIFAIARPFDFAQGRLSARSTSIVLDPTWLGWLRHGSLARNRTRGLFAIRADRGLRWRRMRVAIMFGCETEHDCTQDKADGLFLFRRQDKNLAARRLGRVPLLLHLARRLTWSERYLDRIFS
jgi:hypothetical protein